MNRYTVKLMLWTKRTNREGLHPVYIKITIDRKTSYISTGHYISERMWDEKNEQVKEGHKLASLINPDITNRKAILIRNIVDAQIKGNTFSAAELKQTGNSNRTGHNIFDFIEQFSKEVKHKRTASTIENYKKHSLRLELFHGSRSLNFEDITTSFLEKYETHLREGNKPVGANYTHALFKTLKTFFNAAKRKGLINNYPFSNYENPVYKAPKKDYLSLAELARMEKYADKVTNTVLKQTAVYFLLGCYSGLRISDWITFDASKHVENNRIKLLAKKNGEIVTMPISKPLQRTLKRVSGIALTIEEPTINRTLKVIAEAVSISKRITSHTGRHTFAITLCADQGISSETCAELMGITVATCVSSYYRVTNRKIDKETNAAWKGLA